MSKKRITLKLKTPNPLFEKWLIEWRDEAKAKESKMQYCFSTALQSLKRYPIPLESGRDCKILKGFGDKLCKMLDEKLKEHKRNQEKENFNESNESIYTPQHRSGDYAILIALFESTKASLNKKEILDKAQFYCDSSFKMVTPGAWSSMETLINNNYVIKQSTKYSLTDKGKVIAKKLFDDLIHKELESNKTTSNLEHVNIDELMHCNIIDPNNHKNQTKNSTKSTLTFETLIFEPNSFEIILLVDTLETSGKDQSKDDPIISELNRLKVNFEIRHLKVGDYLWICRHKTTKKELVLPYIIERKRMDDFGKSIKDGRYHEQKFRLKQCGVQNKIYLVESLGKNVHVGLPMTSLMQAAINTMVQDGFMIKFCDNARSTGHYLNDMSKIINKNYLAKTILSCQKENLERSNFKDDVIWALTFEDFMKIGAKYKDFTVKEMFIKHLTSLKGLSIDKALAIADKYPTPRLLIEAYNQTAGDEGEKLISSITFKGNKTIGPVISQVIHRLYSQRF
ncbi:crossover junction endonuclease MUS81 [Onthophagus taurus]|uniref:crossover junction endonuclease MUS81 n=1 Tax=Onthophagus taurus TaxID=166361 RepID=UPI0039BEB293